MSYYNNINLESLTFDFYYFLHVCQEKIEVVNAQADLFAEADHFDAPAIAEKKEVLNARYQQLQVSFFSICCSNSAGCFAIVYTLQPV